MVARAAYIWAKCRRHGHLSVKIFWVRFNANVPLTPIIENTGFQ